MTWKHLAALAIAASMVFGCGVIHICAATGDVFHSVLQLASTIVGGVFGLAMQTKDTK